MHEAEPGEPLAPPKDTALVFGRIVVAENDKPVSLGGIFLPNSEGRFLRVDDGGEELRASLEDDGGFYLLLPPGTYLLAEVGRSFDPKVAFRVPPATGNGEAYYLGTLRLDVRSEEPLIGRSYYLARVRVEDELEPARQTLAKNFPDFKGPVTENLFVHSNQFPSAAQARGEMQDKDERQRLMSLIWGVLHNLSIH